MLDLIIRGGDVVTPQGVARCDVGIKGETIAALAASGTLADSDARRVIDAAGKIVMPGGIDPHVHMRHPFMIPDGTILYTQGPDRVGMARSMAAPHADRFALQRAERRASGDRGARRDFAPKLLRLAYHRCCRDPPPRILAS